MPSDGWDWLIKDRLCFSSFSSIEAVCEFHFRTPPPSNVQIWFTIGFFRLNSHAMPRWHDEMEEEESQELSNRFARSTCGIGIRSRGRDGNSKGTIQSRRSTVRIGGNELIRQ